MRLESRLETRLEIMRRHSAQSLRQKTKYRVGRTHAPPNTRIHRRIHRIVIQMEVHTALPVGKTTLAILGANLNLNSPTMGKCYSTIRNLRRRMKCGNSIIYNMYFLFHSLMLLPLFWYGVQDGGFWQCSSMHSNRLFLCPIQRGAALRSLSLPFIFLGT